MKADLLLEATEATMSLIDGGRATREQKHLV